MPGPAGFLTLAFFLLLIPYGAFKTRSKMAQLVAMPREKYFRSVVIQQLVLAAVALVAVLTEHVWIAPGRIDLPLVAVAVAAVLLFVKLMQPRWRAAVARRDRRTLFIAPRTAVERRWWIAVSVAAGVCEEFVWRGVVAGLLWWITGSWWIAAIVTSVAFGAAHAVQGWKSAVIIGIASFAIQAYVLWAGGLLLAMLIHLSYDIVAGLTYGRLCNEAGLPLSEGPSISPAMVESRIDH